MPRKIQDWSFWYAFDKAYVKFCHRIFYKNISIQGSENIPIGAPVILAPNHQNALMDAIAILSLTPFQPVFMARADIFKGKIIIKILTFLKIMPVYRIRDGYANLGKNDEIFEKALDVLRDKKQLCLMPEGNHGEKRKLRALVKGMFRIAFKAQELYQNNPQGVKIIPVGIDYSDYEKFNSFLTLNFGKPIEVADFFKEYLTNTAVANNTLRDMLSEELKKYMIHIENDMYYDAVYNLSDIYYPQVLKKWNVKKLNAGSRFKAMKYITNEFNKCTDESLLKELDLKIKEYLKSLGVLNLRNWVLDQTYYNNLKLLLQGLSLLLLLPLFIFGAINNYLPFIIPQLMVRNIKDRQFHSSFKFGIGIFMFPVYYLILLIISCLLIRPFWICLAYVILLPISGAFAFRYYVWYKKLVAKFRFNLLNFKGNKILKKTISLRNEIFEIAGKVVGQEQG